MLHFFRLICISINIVILHYVLCRSLSDNKLEYLPDQSFVGNKKLTRLVLKKNPIMSVGTQAFANLPKFDTL